MTIEYTALIAKKKQKKTNSQQLKKIINGKVKNY
jgi:hypothetical protein